MNGGSEEKNGNIREPRRIVIAPYGSLGDLHPMLALGVELRRRGHDVVINTLENYREKIEVLGFEFYPLRPDVDPENRELAREFMDAKSGTEKIVRGLMMANLRPMYEDLIAACRGADALISGEIVYAAPSVVEKTGLKWITTSLAPLSMFSAHDPGVFPVAQWLENLRFLGSGFHKTLFYAIRGTIKDWYLPYKRFRKELELDPDHDPIFDDKYSKLLHLAMFSKVLGKPQPDWHRPTLQTGFCFYDGEQDLGEMPDELNEFLDSGEPPIVFTLGSAAVMDARDFFEVSVETAKILGRRAVLLYGIFNEPPRGLNDDIVGFDYAPFSRLFPRAACVVHQGGAGTTGQVLRAGIPHLIMPYSHDQPDNAARCKRVGVAKRISRDKYTAERAARKIGAILSDSEFLENAAEAAKVVRTEQGTKTACDAIELMI
ncbi:MAG: glycosyltransferase family 1 protein [Pyrinomonadaceae bacterium]|nr:glycosyltransferase family 1 protein [Pyrinomonadaceae bacterium]